MKSGTVARTQGARIAGVVSCVPPRVVDNAHFAERFGDKVADVVRMTGVQTRHWVEDGVTTSDLCARAIDVLVERLDWARDSIDALIFVSQTPDYRLPATACLLQDRLGLRKGVIGIDVSLGCSGYVYALWLASMMVQTGAAKRVLLAVGDTSSIMNDPNDRSTALLFGDAGTATAIEVAEDAASMHFILGTDGSGGESLIVPKGGFRRCVGHPKFADFPNDTLYMDGGEVFNFTLKAVPTLITETIAAAGIATEDYDLFLLHQANTFMIKHLSKKAKLPPEKVPINIDRFGNTSSATLPLLIGDVAADQLRAKPCRVGLFGFGVGWSWSAASLEIGPLACAETVTL
jgi:3-oxoacyl-[acyl-carrier-protein] synthase-3